MRTKKFLKFAAFSAAALAFVGAASAFFAPTLSASASATEETSRDGYGITTGIRPTGDSVLALKHQTITYNLGTPPYDLKEDEKYSSTVTTEYELYNPTGGEVTETFALLAAERRYYSVDFDEAEISPVVTINGSAAEYAVRHTYSSDNSVYSTLSGAEELYDGYASSDFLRPDLPVREYRFKASVNGVGGGVNLTAEMPGDPARTKYISKATYYGDFFVSGVCDGDEFSIYVLGENEDISSLDWTGRRYNSATEDYSTIIDVNVECKEISEATLLDLALSSYDEASGITKEDWYNAVYSQLSDDGTLLAGTFVEELSESMFVRWYTFDITLGAGETAVTTVTSPIYPSANCDRSPYVYEYEYILTPAESFTSCGGVDIVINTSLYSQEFPDGLENKIEEFEGGYKASLAYYSGSEISMSFSSAKNTAISGGLLVVIIISALFGVVIIPVIIIIVCVSTSKDEKRKRFAELEKRRYNMHCVKCGKLLKEGSEYCDGCGAKVESPYIGRDFRMHNKDNRERDKLNILGVVGFAASIYSIVCINMSLVHAFLAALFACAFSVTGAALWKKFRSCYGLTIAGLVISAIVLLLICII